MRKQERDAPDRKWTGRPEPYASRDFETRRIYLSDSVRNPIINKTVNYSATYTTASSYIMVDASATNIEVNLPPAAESKSFTILKTDSSYHTVTIVPDGTDTINGETSLSLTLQYEYVTIISEGTAWYIIGGVSVSQEQALYDIKDLMEVEQRIMKKVELHLASISGEKIEDEDVDGD
jgi:hypothetical protein